MDSLNKRLEQLNKEIAEVIAKADNAQQAYEMERGPVQEGKLKIIWEQRLKDKEMLLPMLLKQRKSLEDHLPFPAHTATNPKDVTLPYLEEVMANMHEHPPSFDDLTDELRLLQKPLPLTPTCLNYFPQSPPTVNQLPQLVASTLVYPANSLAECVGAGLRSCADADDYSGEHSAIIATHFLVIGLMEAVLGFLGIPLRNHQSNTVEPCAAIAATKRPAAQLFMRSILMFKGEVKEVYWKFHEARTQLTKKMANWAPAYHGSREYMVCFAAAGHILRFYAVTRGGHRMKAISPEFDLRMGVDCLKVMHTTIYALTIVLQQSHHQLSNERDPLPFGIRKEHKHAVIYYMGEYIEKRVENWRDVIRDENTLLHTYKVLLELPNGANLSHPPGLIRPLGMLTLVSDIWKVKLPLGWPAMPGRDLLRCAIKDILQGLDALHKESVVHRDIHWDNVLQMSGGEYVLINFELSGMAGALPQLHPVSHWAPECRQPAAPYTTAADIYAVGALMMGYDAVESDRLASSLRDQLMAKDPAQRPSASEALGHPWVQGASCPFFPVEP